MNNLGILLIVGFMFGSICAIESVLLDSYMLAMFAIVMVVFTIVVFTVSIVNELL